MLEKALERTRNSIRKGVRRGFRRGKVLYKAFKGGGYILNNTLLGKNLGGGSGGRWGGSCKKRGVPETFSCFI